MWVYDEEVGLNCREVTFVPGLYKIFDEILGKWFVCLFVLFEVYIEAKKQHLTNVYVFFPYSKCSWQ